MNYPDRDTVIAFLDRSVGEQAITLGEALDAVAEFTRSGYLVVQRRAEDGNRTHVTVSPAAFRCDCGKGLWCPLNHQEVLHGDDEPMKAVVVRGGRHIGPFLSIGEARVWMELNEVTDAEPVRMVEPG